MNAGRDPGNKMGQWQMEMPPLMAREKFIRMGATVEAPSTELRLRRGSGTGSGFPFSSKAGAMLIVPSTEPLKSRSFGIGMAPPDGL